MCSQALAISSFNKRKGTSEPVDELQVPIMSDCYVFMDVMYFSLNGQHRVMEEETLLREIV